MKCPLLKAEGYFDGKEWQVIIGDCIKEECAWWEPKIGKCAVLRMWIALQDIHEVLHDMAAKMPVEEQFRR